jgi:hypothetical protein
MAIMPPDTPLWHEVVKEEGLAAVWPLDSEDTARNLQAAWAKVADSVGEGGFQVGQAAGVVNRSWPDRAGAATVDAVTAYFERIRETSLQMAWTGIYGLTYADHIEKAKTAVKDTIAGWEEAYAAAGAPAFGKDTAYDQSLVVFHAAQKCFKIIDDAARDVATTLVTTATEDEIRNDRGTLDNIRQLGNLGRLFDKLTRKEDWGQVLAPITGAKTADDVDNGEPLDQAIASNWAGFAANIGTGVLAAGAAGAAGAAAAVAGPVGILAGMTAGAFTSGAVDSMYENGPTHIMTALDRGGERVVETFQGMGEALGSAVGMD